MSRCTYRSIRGACTKDATDGTVCAKHAARIADAFRRRVATDRERAVLDAAKAWAADDYAVPSHPFAEHDTTFYALLSAIRAAYPNVSVSSGTSDKEP